MNKPRRAAQVSLIHDCALHARRMHVGKDGGRGGGESGTAMQLNGYRGGVSRLAHNDVRNFCKSR